MNLPTPEELLLYPADYLHNAVYETDIANEWMQRTMSSVVETTDGLYRLTWETDEYEGIVHVFDDCIEPVRAELALKVIEETVYLSDSEVGDTNVSFDAITDSPAVSNHAEQAIARINEFDLAEVLTWMNDIEPAMVSSQNHALWAAATCFLSAMRDFQKDTR